MDLLWQELTFGLGSGPQVAHVLLRLVVAALLGSLVGIQRQRTHKPAGLRTHILVCLGSCLVVVACSGMGMSFDGQSRVIQGILTGVGFIGAGSILKLSQEQEIKGLTTAAGVWMTATIGIACGLGAIGISLIATFMTMIVLVVVKAIEQRAARKIQE